ncbi:MAG: TRAP transporter large permease subunit [Kiloniellales bacterium]|nr:TRAP transporter large permease subunit [Kiloniellales bacterium]MDJ0969294.1 TRAP transporter large permease subunit [Kiloniellales bacterium]
MSWETLTIALYVATLLVLLGGGVWVGLALLGVGLIGIELLTTRPAGDAMATTIWSSLSSWPLVALPLFVWMGEILTRSGMGSRLFSGLAPIVRHLPGRLLHVNIAGCTLFAAISGSSAATVSTVGKISLPELRRRGYPESMAVGSLAGAGTLGLLMPPSIILIVYGVSINESIPKLFMAGIGPAVVLALLFVAYVALWSLAKGEASTVAEEEEASAAGLSQALSLLPLIGLIGVILGSIYFGFLTATEAAALGVLGALALSHLDGSLSVATFVEGVKGGLKTSCMIGLILAGSATVTLSMGYTGIPRSIAEAISTLNLSSGQLLLLLGIFYIILGMFLDGISAVVLTMAVIEPMIRQAGIDTIWFGIFLVILVETAQITPPVGFNLFVIQSMTKLDILYIARAAAPLFMLMILMLFLVWYFPQMALHLPSTL